MKINFKRPVNVKGKVLRGVHDVAADAIPEAYLEALVAEGHVDVIADEKPAPKKASKPSKDAE